ncbi:MAG TPA: PEPxxWA-CTERM sorting domain-containing protein [Roseiarcus sp.]
MGGIAKVGAVVAFALLSVGAARADTTLLTLTDPAATTTDGTVYDLGFIATESTTTISVGGYDAPAFLTAKFNSVTPSGGGSNLLGGAWTLVPAASGSFPGEFDDGTGVPALEFGATGPDYDTFSQTFATTPGAEYVYTFTFVNSNGGTPSALLVTTSGDAVSVVPEPSTWAMMLIGFVGLGGAARYHTTRKGRSLSRA